jgi:hypothetical protein
VRLARKVHKVQPALRQLFPVPLVLPALKDRLAHRVHPAHKAHRELLALKVRSVQLAHKDLPVLKEHKATPVHKVQLVLKELPAHKARKATLEQPRLFRVHKVTLARKDLLGLRVPKVQLAQLVPKEPLAHKVPLAHKELKERRVIPVQRQPFPVPKVQLARRVRRVIPATQVLKARRDQLVLKEQLAHKDLLALKAHKATSVRKVLLVLKEQPATLAHKEHKATQEQPRLFQVHKVTLALKVLLVLRARKVPRVLLVPKAHKAHKAHRVRLVLLVPGQTFNGSVMAPTVRQLSQPQSHLPMMFSTQISRLAVPDRSTLAATESLCQELSTSPALLLTQSGATVETVATVVSEPPKDRAAVPS